MNGTMLVVEDDEVFGQVVQQAMERLGFAVQCAVDLKQAEAMARSRPPQYVILDLKLEHESTLPFIPLLLEINRNVRILMLTGYASIATAVEAMKLGAADYLAKPAETDDILKALLSDESNPNLPVNEGPMSVQRLEWEHIQKILHENGGNISATARQLNMHRRTLQRKLQKRPKRS